MKPRIQFIASRERKPRTPWPVIGLAVGMIVAALGMAFLEYPAVMIAATISLFN